MEVIQITSSNLGLYILFGVFFITFAIGYNKGFIGIIAKIIAKLVCILGASLGSILLPVPIYRILLAKPIESMIMNQIAANPAFLKNLLDNIPDFILKMAGINAFSININNPEATYVLQLVVGPLVILALKFVLFFVLLILFKFIFGTILKVTQLINGIVIVGAINKLAGGILLALTASGISFFILNILGIITEIPFNL